MATCFVSMPSTPPFDTYYKVLARAIVQAGLDPILADDMDRPRAIRDQIAAGLSEAAICVVDLTGRSLTSLYVLGMAHGTGKPLVQLVQNQDDLPFDLKF